MNNKLEKSKAVRKLIIASLAISIGLAGLTGCDLRKNNNTEQEQSSKPATVITSTIKVVTNPSLEEITKKDPFAQISKSVMEAYNPDKALYNRLFEAMDNLETKVDISVFPLTFAEKYAVCDSMYEQAGFQFYYVDKIKLSKDGKSVAITYNENGETAIKNKELIYGKLNHLVYNVAPDNYSPLQKLFSVYVYITAHADYTDNMTDVTTFAPYSILLKGKGICGGFASLGYYVLNRVGVPTDYISNEPHAWNMVEIEGEKYHTDMTWGAGSYGSGFNSLTTILMDDEKRNSGLENAGFGGYEIIKGYPRDNPEKPVPAEDKSFQVYYDFNYWYALDVENNKVYYCDDEGIKRMSLEGKEVEKLSSMQGTFLTFYNGILYFVNTKDTYLYKLQPGKEAELLDNSLKVSNMYLKDGILFYEEVNGRTKKKTLNLNSFDQTGFDIKTSKHQIPVTVKRQESFKFEIEFSTKMNTEFLPKEAVVLVNKEGQALPIHMSWSEDGGKLTVCSKEFLEKEAEVYLYVAPGIAAADGSKSKDAYDITVNIQ